MSAPEIVRSDTPSRFAWLSGVLLLGLLVFVVVHRSEEEALARLMAREQPIWLLTAVLFQALTYLCAAAVWQRGLVRHGIAGRPRGLHGVPIETALAATLLLRGFTFWLPMLPGFALSQREIAGGRAGTGT